jgi:hypothetical protein
MTAFFVIDRRALAATTKAISAEIIGLKRLLGGRWARPMAEEQRRLSHLRLRATELYVLSAYARGKRHLGRAPANAPSDFELETYQRRITERLGPSYARLALESCA